MHCLDAPLLYLLHFAGDACAFNAVDADMKQTHPLWNLYTGAFAQRKSCAQNMKPGHMLRKAGRTM